MQTGWEWLRYREHPNVNDGKNVKDGKRKGWLMKHIDGGRTFNFICVLMTLGYAVFTWFNTNADWTAFWEHTESHTAWWSGQNITHQKSQM